MSVADELQKLEDLRSKGVLTNAEFEAEKLKVLGNGQAVPTGTGPTPSVAQPPQSASTLPAGAWLAIIGGALAVVSSFLPWLSANAAFVGGINRNSFQLGQNNGFSIDGVVLVVLGALAIVIGVTRLTRTSMPRWLQRSPIVLGIVFAAVAGNHLPSINDTVHKVQNLCSGACTASIGFGLYITFVAAVLALIGGMVLRSKKAV